MSLFLVLCLPPVLLLAIFLLWTLYRVLNPLPQFPILKQIEHCVVGHRAAPIIKPVTPINSHHTNDHTKGVFDENGFIIPENTLPSFALAKQSGVVTVELDVQLTKDKKCVVFHDQVIGNTLRCPEDHKKLRISDFDYDQLVKMQFLTTLPQGDKISPYDSAHVTLLSDVLAYCKKEMMNIMIEIKTQPDLKTCCTQVVALVNEHRMEDRVFVASFTPMVNWFIRQLSTNICTGFLFTPMASTTLKLEMQRQNIKVPVFFQSSFICWLLDSTLTLLGHPYILWLSGYKLVMPNFCHLSHCVIDQYQRWGQTILTWTVNDPAIRDYSFTTLDVSVITDHPTLELVLRGTDQAKKLD